MAKRKTKSAISANPVEKSDELLKEVSNKYYVMNEDFMSFLPHTDEVLRKAGVSIDVYLEMTKDPQIIAVAQKRKRYIQSYAYEIDAEDEKIKQFVSDVIGNLNMVKIIDGLFLGVEVGYAVLELIWEIDNDGKFIIKDVKKRNPLRFQFTKSGQLAYPDTQTRIFKTAPYGKFVIYTHEPTDDSNLYGNALNGACFWYWSFKKKGWGFWLNVIQKYGLPPLIYKADQTGLDDDDLNKKTGQLSAVQSGASIVIDEQEDIKAIDIKADKESFEKFIQLADEQIAKVYLGTTALSESSKYGTYANSQVQQEGLENIVIGDLKGFQNAIRQYIIKPLIKFNFGDNAEIPTIIFKKEEKNNTTEENVTDEKQNTEDTNTKQNKNTNTQDNKQNQSSKAETEEFALFNEFVSLDNAPDHTKGLENMVLKLYKKNKAIFKGLFQFKQLDDNPKKAIKQLKDYEPYVAERLSKYTSYAMFYAIMLAKYEIKKQTEGFSINKIKELFVKLNVYDMDILDFKEARKAFAKKVVLTDDEFNQLTDKAKSQAFRVAGVESKRVVSLVNEALQKNFNEKGKWKEQARQILGDYNYDITGNHLETIYRTNVFQSYSVAQWGEYKLVEKSFPALRYTAVMDNRTRPAHAALNDRVFMQSDPIWGRIYPPNGYNCRCTTIPLSKKKLKSVKVDDGTSPEWKDFRVDDGFNYNPALDVRKYVPSNYGDNFENKITYQDYGLNAVKSFNYSQTFNNEKQLKNNIEISDAIHNSVLIPKGQNYKLNLIKDIMQTPSEVWIQTANNRNGTKTFKTIYVKSYFDKKSNTEKKYAVTVDKYNQIIGIKELSTYTGIRAGALIYYAEEI